VRSNDFPGAFTIRSQLALERVVIDGEVDARMRSYESCLTDLIFLGMSDFDKSCCSPDFKVTRTREQLQTTAKEDLKFLMAAVRDGRAARDADLPDYLR
jgi:hypothetical protein